MPLILEDEELNQLKDSLAQLKSHVTLKLFYSHSNKTGEIICNLALDLGEISPFINVESHIFERSREEADKYDVIASPCILVLGRDGEFKRVKFYGIPMGIQINSFVNFLLEVGGAGAEVPVGFRKTISSIDKFTHVKVFVTLNCLHCVKIVNKLQKLAIENENIYVDIYDVGEFPRKAAYYKIDSVPTMVVNNTELMVGNMKMEELIEKLKPATPL